GGWTGFGQAGHVADATECLRCRAEGTGPTIDAVLAEPRLLEIDDAGIEFAQAIVAQSHPVPRSRRIALEHHVGVTDEILQDPLALGLLQVERYRELARVDLHERAAAIESVSRRRRHCVRGSLSLGASTEGTSRRTEAHAIGARLVLDLDHLGAKCCEV